MADLHGRPLSAAVWLWIVAAGAAFALSILAIIPLRFGEAPLKFTFKFTLTFTFCALK
jgi:hypothetical protein